MLLRQISLHHIRSYELFHTAIDPSITLILGNNGSGKTTLLEALYVLHRGTSFRGRDRDMIRHQETAAEIRLDLADSTERRLHLDLHGEKASKRFTIDGRTSPRLPAKARLPVVLFEPDELRLLSSSPARRRQFLDDIIARLYPSYAAVLNRYARVLLQRNELLKQQQTTPEQEWESRLFAWDISFSELGAALVAARCDFIELSNQHLSRLYSGMAGREHIITVNYETRLSLKNYQQHLLKQLHATRQTDIAQGYTSHGPHRDDFCIALDGHTAADTASRGEMRTIMLAYKLLEVELQHELTATPPLILMDDVFSELDSVREQHLMHSLTPYQTIVTATDLRNELKQNASTIWL